MALIIDRLRQALGNAVSFVGDKAGIPESGISEWVAGGPTKDYTPQANASGGYSQAPNQSTLQPGIYDSSGNQIGSSNTVQFANNPTPSQGGGGGNTGGGGSTSSIGPNVEGTQNVDFFVDEFGNRKPITDNPNSRYYDQARNSAAEASKRALEAALGVFDSRKQGLLNRIPGLESARDLRLRGLDEGLSQFTDTANREKDSRVSSIEQTAQSTADDYKVAERQQRSTAKGLARQLRNIFAASGTIDSTQFRDQNIEQSQSILQSLGDLRRSGAEKQAVFGKEKEDVNQYYSEKITQQSQQVALAKDEARAQTDAQIQSVLDDVDLNDAQKIEAVQAANQRLEARLSDLDQQELSFNQQAAKDAQELAIKLQELKSKGNSSAYTAATQDRKAFADAVSVIGKLKDQLGQITPQAAESVFSQYGFSDDEAKRLSQTYASSTRGNQSNDILNSSFFGG